MVYDSLASLKPLEQRLPFLAHESNFSNQNTTYGLRGNILLACHPQRLCYESVGSGIVMATD